MKVLISERLSEHKYKTPEGYLICTDAILARTGKQRYTKDELFGNGDSEEVDVDRPYEQVMNEKTISSFENKPVTFDHPDEDVNVGNYKEYAVGYVRDVHQGKVDGRDVILGNLVITDQDAIDAIENGEHTDLSCGYACDIKDDGHGSYYQNNIRGNHVALCREGRAGNARIIDSKLNDSAIGGHYKNNRGENFFICSYGSGFSIFKADGEYLDGSRHLSLDGVKQRILSYNLTKVKDSAKDSTMKDESEDWTEMLIKLAVKNGKNSSGDYEYDGDADVNQVRRVLKKLGYKGNGYVKNPKSYLHKLHYYFTDSEILEDMSSDPVVVKDDNLLGKRVRIRKRYSDLDGTIGTIYSYEGTNYDDEVEVKRNGHIYKVNYEDIEFLDSKANDADKYSYRLAKTKNDYDEYVIKAYKNGKYYEDASYYTDDWQDALDTLKMMAKREGLNFRQEGSRYVADSVNANTENLDVKKLNAVRKEYRYQPSRADLQEIVDKYKLNSDTAWYLLSDWGFRNEYGKLHFYDSNIVDALSSSEKDLCDYMLENCREEDEDENDLLKKMKLYYSAYSSLARNKPNEVLDYFREHIDDSFNDSIKDSSNLSASKALKMIGIVSMLHKK